MDYAEILTRIREETRKAQEGFLRGRVNAAETAAIELLRLSCKLLDEAETTSARQSEAAGRRSTE
jgi:hypothetical protein